MNTMITLWGDLIVNRYAHNFSTFKVTIHRKLMTAVIMIVLYMQYILFWGASLYCPGWTWIPGLKWSSQIVGTFF
jgi:hypothetical protein